MTEDEAKTKWCPHVRGLAASVGAAANRTLDGGRHRSADCIASACMAWRWINPDSEAPEGFCGLAGRP
jgi:hypothetical protein